MLPREARFRRLNERPMRPSGELVLYWIQSARRLHKSHALDHALALAAELRRPLVVYEGLRLDYPWASPRLHRFVLEGMRESRQEAERVGLTYWPFVETRPGEGRGLLERLARRAAVVVTDDFPAFILPGQSRALAARCEVSVLAVDGSGLVPLSALGGPVTAAAQLRRRLHRALLEGWCRPAASRPAVGRAPRRRLEPPFDPWTRDRRPRGRAGAPPEVRGVAAQRLRLGARATGTSGDGPWQRPQPLPPFRTPVDRGGRRRRPGSHAAMDATP